MSCLSIVYLYIYNINNTITKINIHNKSNDNNCNSALQRGKSAKIKKIKRNQHTYLMESKVIFTVAASTFRDL